MTPKTSLSFVKDSAARAALLRWWEGLEENKGSRAELRRCKTLDDVAFCPAYHRLLHTIGGDNHSQWHRERIALLAGLLAQVKRNNEHGNPAEQMASHKPGGNGALVSGLRFRRLLALREVDNQLFSTFRRLLQLMDNQVNIPRLANDLYWWNDQTRKQYAFDYYKQAPSNEK